jgi:hypothetical protein
MFYLFMEEKPLEFLSGVSTQLKGVSGVSTHMKRGEVEAPPWAAPPPIY